MFCHAFTVCSSFLALAAFASGCSSSSDDGVKPKLEVTNQTRSALEGDAITSITGTYGAACEGRSSAGTDTWFVQANGVTNLAVVKNDTACVLTMRTIETAEGSFVGAPAIGLDNVWQSAGSAFSLATDNTAAVRFYGNAELSAKTFTADFVVSVLVSDAPSAADGGGRGATGFATRSSSMSADSVSASDYSISFGAFGISQDINHVVDAVSGYAQLATEAILGEDYAIVSDVLDGSSSFAAVDAAFHGTPGTHGLLSDLTTLQLPAAGFALPTSDLDSSPQRTVIIRHTDRGVSAYQLLLVTFTP